MVVSVHDILKISSGTPFITSGYLPSWTKDAIKAAPYVVVRRGSVKYHKIPIGLRGDTRQQRQAAFLLAESIEAVFTPEDLVDPALWQRHTHLIDLGIADRLQAVDRCFSGIPLSWGIGGSVGFELISGREVVGTESDIDIIMKASLPLRKGLFADLKEKLDSLPFKTDVLLETPNGAISLDELIAGRFPMVLRTPEGPRLIDHL